jgi:hypothetical protein
MDMNELYSREAIERGYHELTDRQWEILEQELADSDEEEWNEIVTDFMANTKAYEDEHDSWNEGREAYRASLQSVDPAKVHENDHLPELLAALEIYDAGKWEEAEIALEPIAIAGNRLAIFKYANTLDNLGKLVAAEHYWRIAVSAGDTNAANNLANLLQDQGREDEVLPLYLASAEAGSIDAMVNLGIYIEDADPDGAEKWFLKAVEAGSDKACANLALKYFAEGLNEEGIRYAELGISRGSIYSASALVMYHYNRKEIEETIATARRVLPVWGDDKFDDPAHPFKMLVISLMQLMRFDEAEEALNGCIAAGVPDTKDLENWLVLAKAEQAENDDLGMDVPSVDTGPRYCTECGSARVQGAAFCGTCGTRLA